MEFSNSCILFQELALCLLSESNTEFPLVLMVITSEKQSMMSGDPAEELL